MTTDDILNSLVDDLERIAIALERLNDQVDTALVLAGYICPQ